MTKPETVCGYDVKFLEEALRNYEEAAQAIRTVLAAAGIVPPPGQCGREHCEECGMKNAAECATHRELQQCAPAPVLN